MDSAGLTKTEKQYVTSNQVIKGVIDHLGKEQMDQAVMLYSHCQEDIGYLLMHKVPQERPLQMRMAKMFFMAKDFEKSAQMLEGMGEHQRAAELYEKTDQYENAAEMWAKVGDLERAAHNYEKAGVWQTAADLYTKVENYEKAALAFEKAVNHFLAGKYYFQIKKYQKSMELLQKVGQDDETYLEAAMMIGNILAINGYLDMAVAKYKAVTKTMPISKGTLSIYYNLGQLLEKKGDVFEAGKVYKEISELDPDYRDVKDRLCKVDEAMCDHVEVVETSEEELEVIEDLEPIEEEIEVPGSTAQEAAPQARIVSVMEGFEFLKSTPIFDCLSLTEMKQLWNITENREMQPGDIIIEQAQPGKALYIVKKGNVIVKSVQNGKETDLADLGPGSHVGEMSLVDEAPTSARVVAGAEGASLFEITREKFEELLEANDKIAIKLYKVFVESLCDRLRKTTAELSAVKAGKT